MSGPGIGHQIFKTPKEFLLYSVVLPLIAFAVIAVGLFWWIGPPQHSEEWLAYRRIEAKERIVRESELDAAIEAMKVRTHAPH